MRCWKCQKETDDSTPECAQCAGAADFCPEAMGTPMHRYELDWDAVQTVEDFRLVVRLLNIKILVADPPAAALRPFLRKRRHGA